MFRFGRNARNVSYQLKKRNKTEQVSPRLKSRVDPEIPVKFRPELSGRNTGIPFRVKAIESLFVSVSVSRFHPSGLAFLCLVSFCFSYSLRLCLCPSLFPLFLGGWVICCLGDNRHSFAGVLEESPEIFLRLFCVLMGSLYLSVLDLLLWFFSPSMSLSAFVHFLCIRSSFVSVFFPFLSLCPPVRSVPLCSVLSVFASFPQLVLSSPSCLLPFSCRREGSWAAETRPTICCCFR